MLPGARLGSMTARDAPPLRWLNAAAVVAAMPPLSERLELAERTMVALLADAELPPKIAVHPRPTGSFAHAMPAHLRDREPVGAADLLGIKWIAGVPENRSAGLPALHGLVVLNDPATGVPVAILDAAPITAERTAAVSGVAIRLFAPPPKDSARRVAILGAGVQARSHLLVIGETLAGAHVEVFDRHPDRAAAVADEASRTAGIAEARAAASARHAVMGADVV